MQTIDVKRLADEQSRMDVDVIDVRMPTEFREIHAECARNVAKLTWNQCGDGGGGGSCLA